MLHAMIMQQSTTGLRFRGCCYHSLRHFETRTKVRKRREEVACREISINEIDRD